jgi:transposase
MHFYTGQHRFYCGVDRHTRTLSLCVLDQAGGVALEATLPPEPDQFLEALAPFRDGLVVGCECLFAWYWLADLCAVQGIPFVLGHALYLKAIHGGKTKTDTIDARKLARLLRGGTFAQAYVYPKAMRATRDLLRRRTYLVRKRAELLAHLQMTFLQYNLTPPAQKLAYAANCAGLDLGVFPDPSTRSMLAADLAVVTAFSQQIKRLEAELVRTAKVHDPQAFHRLRTVPGIGPVLALILLYEVQDIGRFEDEGRFLSYARLVGDRNLRGSGPLRSDPAPQQRQHDPDQAAPNRRRRGQPFVGRYGGHRSVPPDREWHYPAAHFGRECEPGQRLPVRRRPGRVHLQTGHDGPGPRDVHLVVLGHRRPRAALRDVRDPLRCRFDGTEGSSRLRDGLWRRPHNGRGTLTFPRLRVIVR